MNYRVIHDANDLVVVINSSIFICKSRVLQQQEIDSNMWALSIDQHAKEFIESVF